MRACVCVCRRRIHDCTCMEELQLVFLLEDVYMWGVGVGVGVGVCVCVCVCAMSWNA